MNIWVNGVFDILHIGHIDLLWFAKLYKTDDLPYEEAIKQNKLIVGIDSDSRVKKLKGEKRPINDILFRGKMLINLKMIDDLYIFSSDDELRELVKLNNIDYLIVGDHYKNKEVIGGENARLGVVFYPTTNMSTTSIIKKIKNL